MNPNAETPAAFLAALPDDRRKALAKVRAVIRKHLPKGVRETMQRGTIAYAIPHSVYPAGYHCDPSQPLPVANLACAKGHMALNLFCCYLDPDLAAMFKDAWNFEAAPLNMGKGCVRFKSLDDIDLHAVAALFDRFDVDAYVAKYETVTRRG